MLCLLLDLKFPCQKIADLRFKHVRGIVDGDFDGIFCFSSDGSDEIMGGLPCSARTVKAIQDWVMEVDSAFGWKYKVRPTPHCAYLFSSRMTHRSSFLWLFLANRGSQDVSLSNETLFPKSFWP